MKDLITLLNTKISFLDVLKTILPLGTATGLIGITYSQNRQIYLTLSRTDDLIKQVNVMNTELKDLELKIAEKNKYIEELQIQMSTISKSNHSGVEELVARNDMIKFYITCAGVLVGGLIIISLTNYFLPSLFTTKAWVPAPIYKALQDNTWFFQEQQVYPIIDKKCELEWLVTIFNQNKAEISVKPSNTNDFIPISDFVSKLQNDSNYLVKFKPQQDTSLDLFPHTDLLDVSTTTSSSFPSANETAEIATYLSNLI